MNDDHRPKRFRAVIEFQGYDGDHLRRAGLPPLPDRIRECIETHPTASFPIDSVSVEEIEEKETEFRRASGQCVCANCGKLYYDHPLGGPNGYDGNQFLRRLCNGDLVKL